MSVYDDGGLIGTKLDLGSTETYPAGVAADITTTVVYDTTDVNDLTTYTFSGTLSATPSAGDRLVIVAHGEGYDGSNTVSSIIYNGSSVTIHASPTQTGQVSNVGIASLSGITSTSFTLSVTFSFQQYRAAVRIYLLSSPGGSVLFNTAGSSAGNATSRSVALTTIPGSRIISGATHNDPGTSFSWSTDTFELYDQDMENARRSGAISGLINTTSFITTSTNTSSANHVLACASFYPVAPSNLKNSGIWNLAAVYLNKRGS
jgi:hypothetical protein